MAGWGEGRTAFLAGHSGTRDSQHGSSSLAEVVSRVLAFYPTMLNTGISSRRWSLLRLVSTTRRSMMSLQQVAHHHRSERGTPHSSTRGGALVPLPLPLPLPLMCRASRRSVSSLPDACGLPVVTSSWRAIKSLDEAYTEVKPSVDIYAQQYL